MAAHQSSPLCAPPGLLLLLLLLIGVISTHLPEVHTRAIVFWCRKDARKEMMEWIKDKDCVGSDTLPAPVQLPCVWEQAAKWANKTLQQKRADVLGSLQVFHGGLQDAMNQTTGQCQTLVLNKLEHSIRNYLVIVNTLHIQSDELTTSPPVAQNCSNQTSLKEVLTQYRNLIDKKLEQFAEDLHDSVCRGGRRTINNTGHGG